MQSSAIRVFLSSTFDDFRAERDALAPVFAELERFCRAQGATFLAVDLRWGVSAEAWRDRQTLEICLDEVAYCRRVSPRLSLLCLLGERYGTRVLPTRVPADQMEALRTCLDPSLFDRWYRRDDNALPAEFRLEPIADPMLWGETEARLREGVERGAEVLGWPLDDPRRERFERSISHWEIAAGIFDGAIADPAGNAFCYRRRLQGLPELAPPGHPARVYASYHPDGSRDGPMGERLARLGAAVASRLPPGHCREYEGSWTGEAAEIDLPAFCQLIRTDLESWLAADVGSQPAPTAGEREDAAHAAFGAAARAGFVGQAGPLKALRAYLRDKGDRRPLAIVGPAGCGKTALLAQAAQVLPRRGAVAISRFAGTTPGSSVLRPLLADLCRALAGPSGLDEIGRAHV